MSDERFWSQLPPYGTNPFAAFFERHPSVPRLPSPPPGWIHASDIPTLYYGEHPLYGLLRSTIHTGSFNPLPPGQEAVEGYFARAPTFGDAEDYQSDHDPVFHSYYMQREEGSVNVPGHPDPSPSEMINPPPHPSNSRRRRRTRRLIPRGFCL